MSELRQDVTTGEWVIFAANRKKRPYDFEKKSEPKADTRSKCPFCPENEDKVPNILYQDKKDWSIRVFLNKYPALDEENMQIQESSFHNSILGWGVHEILLDTPEHLEQLASFEVFRIFNIIKVLQSRFLLMRQKEDIQYVQIFKNSGADAGMSLMHSHWQILGVPMINRIQRDIYQRAKEYTKEKESCIYCDMIQYELKEKIRIVTQNELFVAFCPFASKLCYEIWIAPKAHIATFGDLSEPSMAAFAEILKDCLQRLLKLREDISFNICFMDMPKLKNGEKYFHWYVKIVPRMGSFAGYELATGSFINPVLPEKAAQQLRECEAEGE